MFFETFGTYLKKRSYMLKRHVLKIVQNASYVNIETQNQCCPRGSNNGHVECEARTTMFGRRHVADKIWPRGII
jgi:hypothetical protein